MLEHRATAQVEDRRAEAKGKPDRPLAACKRSPGGRGEWQHEGQGRIVQAESAIAFVPARGTGAFCVDEQGDAADFFGDADTAISSAQQEGVIVESSRKSTLRTVA